MNIPTFGSPPNPMMLTAIGRKKIENQINDLITCRSIGSENGWGHGGERRGGEEGVIESDVIGFATKPNSPRN